jgi:hypothetical protein
MKVRIFMSSKNRFIFSQFRVSISVVDTDPGGKNYPQKYKKINKFHFLKDLDVIFLGMKSSPDVLYGCPGISKLQLLIKKRLKKSVSTVGTVFFLQFLLMKILDPDLYPDQGFT